MNGDKTLLLIAILWVSDASGRQSKPNIVLFVADDFGYGDLQSYGHPTQEAGAVDRMAADGIRFTQFYAVHTFCTPSRASMLTGRYAMRSGMLGEIPVLLPGHSGGLPHSEVTIAEILKAAGYKTGIVGKWHQGINKHNYTDGLYLPHTHGFDYVGHILPWTLSWHCDTLKRHLQKPAGMCVLYNNTTMIQQPIHLENLTATFLMDAKAFIYDNEDRPFFLYFSLPQTHTPMFNNPAFKGKSRRGIYGDQVNEMNWAVGEIIELLQELNLAENTLTMFVSDHGPHREMCTEGGTSGSLRGGKGVFYEGGMRIPAVAWWPGTIPQGQVSTDVASLLDILPTFTELAGGQLPTDRKLDGSSFLNLLDRSRSHTNQTDKSTNHPLFFHCDEYLMAVRYGQYKIYFRDFNSSLKDMHKKNCDGYIPRDDAYIAGAHDCQQSFELNPPHIYDLHVDPSEEFLLSNSRYENVLKEVQMVIQEHRSSLNNLPPRLFNRDRLSRSLVPCCNPPYCFCKVRT